MKSLLVDALRQKDDERDGDSLSDSGSYATSRADVAATGAGGAGDSGASDDLELMATGAFIVANDERPPGPDASEGSDADAAHFGLTRTLAGDTTRVITVDDVVPTQDSLPSMPPVARHTPMACAVLALLSALMWFGFQQLELQQEQPRFAGNTNVLRADPPAGENSIAGTAPRFRYLGLDGQPLDDEVWQ